MTIFHENEQGMILLGDSLKTLNELPDGLAQTCVTSPPYFGLRDYGHDGQIGLEETPDMYVQRLVDVFREVRRVLRDDGTLWLNLGDSYVTKQGKGDNIPQTKWKANSYPEGAAHRSHDFGVAPKNLIGIPWRVAFALQQDGWYLRQDIIWHKPNTMPESVKDRCTKAHEYIFLFSKKPKYHFACDEIKEPAKYGAKGSEFHTGKTGEHQARRSSKKPRRTDAEKKRNRRSVWTVSTKPYKGAHFATFPPDLIEPCILAGCPEGDIVLDPFGGSGTTAMVASRLGRKFIHLDISEEYCDLAVERINKGR